MVLRVSSLAVHMCWHALVTCEMIWVYSACLQYSKMQTCTVQHLHELHGRHCQHSRVCWQRGSFSQEGQGAAVSTLLVLAAWLCLWASGKRVGLAVHA